jgi:hypothetical protein
MGDHSEGAEMEQVLERRQIRRNTSELVRPDRAHGLFPQTARLASDKEADPPSEAGGSCCPVRSNWSKMRHEHASQQRSLAELALLCMEKGSTEGYCAFSQEASTGRGWRGCPLLSLLCSELRHSTESLREAY